MASIVERKGCTVCSMCGTAVAPESPFCPVCRGSFDGNPVPPDTRPSAPFDVNAASKSLKSLHQRFGCWFWVAIIVGAIIAWKVTQLFIRTTF